MPTLERQISIRGPKFYLEGEALMFVRHIDGSTREGPRPATADDRKAYPEAHAEFRRGGEAALGPLVSFRDPGQAGKARGG